MADKLLNEARADAYLWGKVASELIEAVEFYADPNTYFAIAFISDPPHGEFMEDFEEDSEGGKPGKRAREVLERVEFLLENKDLHDAIIPWKELYEALKHDVPNMIETAVEPVKQERDELQRTFDLMWAADQRAIKLWQSAGEGRELIGPDRAKLTEWLLNKIDNQNKALNESVKTIEDLLGRSYNYPDVVKLMTQRSLERIREILK